MSIESCNNVLLDQNLDNLGVHIEMDKKSNV